MVHVRLYETFDGKTRLVKKASFADYNATKERVGNRWVDTGTWGWKEWAKPYFYNHEAKYWIMMTGPRGVSSLVLQEEIIDKNWPTRDKDRKVTMEHRRRYGRDVYRRATLACPKCGRQNFLTKKGLDEHIVKAHLRGSVKKAYGVGKKSRKVKRHGFRGGGRRGRDLVTRKGRVVVRVKRYYRRRPRKKGRR